jgi:hypothetical protein
MKSAEFIGWALGGLEREIAQTRQRLTILNEQAARLRTRMGPSARRAGTAAAAPSFNEPGASAVGPRRTMSPEAKRRMSQMMKKRWAERRRQKKRTLKD